jgi:nucleoside-diphosphate-sugar epimerase
MESIKVIITGVTGMVGEGVLHECLKHEKIDEVLVLSRRSCGITHSKLRELLHDDFFNISPVADKLKDYSACFFCLGVSSVGMSEEKYHHLTYDLTLHVVKVMLSVNPGMTFCYISGVGTDSSEKGRIMWARVKGKTENELLKLPFKAAYMLRPGYLQPTKGMSHTHKFYYFISWLYPVLRPVISKYACSLSELAQAMIRCIVSGGDKPILEVKDIVALAKS